MKKRNLSKSALAVSAIRLLSSLSSCFSSSHKRMTITIIEDGGTNTEYNVRNGTSFDYSIADNGKLFMGCYEKEEGKGKKYVTHDGKSVIWGDSMPDRLYSYYVPKDHLAFSADPINEKNTIIASNGAGETKLSFDEAYLSYRSKSNHKALAEVSFSFYDNPNTVWDNWSDFKIDCNGKTIYKNSLRANVEPVPFSEVFELDSQDLAKGVSVFYSHAAGNRSGEISKISDFKFNVRLLTKEELDSEISFEKLGKEFAQYLPDGSQYRRLVTKQAAPGTEIPYYVKKLIEKNKKCSLAVDFSISSYGQKGNALLVQLSNWVDANCKLLDANGNTLETKFVKLENNSNYSVDECTIGRDEEKVKKLAKALVELNRPDANCSGQTYQTKFIKVVYRFADLPGNN